jgi:integrase
MAWEQRDAFFAAAAAETRYATLFAVLVEARLRPGEAFALRPGDIDWGARAIRVERAWNLGRVRATKTYEERTVDLTPLVRADGAGARDQRGGLAVADHGVVFDEV